MADLRTGNKLPKWSTRENTPGVRVDSGPFIGVIKNNLDPARLGRLQVWIPDLGGDENEPSNWYTVSYASPFMGATRGVRGSPDEASFGIEQQTYGFWAVPPDIDNYVLLTFVMGDASRGFWFACIPNTPGQHMLPGIARPVDNTKVIINDDFSGRFDQESSYLPVTELNYDAPGVDNDPNFITRKRLIHPFQANIVIQQGLDTDPQRGTITSSSQRDTPSRVVGLSTPGRTFPDETDLPNFESLLKSGSLKVETFQSKWITRKGGHSFVMDDGDAFGKNNLVRLRTAGGHQILMNDTDNIFYIINKEGTSYVELAPDGSVHVYSKSNINLRAGSDFNIHADGNVNINAGDTINMYAGQTFKTQTKNYLLTADTLYNLNSGILGIKAGGSMTVKSISGSWETSGLLALTSNTGTWKTASELSLYSSTGGWKTTGGDLKLFADGNKIYLNTAGQVPTAPVAPVAPLINEPFNFYRQKDVVLSAASKRWIAVDRQFESIAPLTPTHEPWSRKPGTQRNI